MCCQLEVLLCLLGIVGPWTLGEVVANSRSTGILDIGQPSQDRTYLSLATATIYATLS